jgi:uncharacterized membrane protein YhhN
MPRLFRLTHGIKVCYISGQRTLPDTMSRFGTTLFNASPFVRWSLSPFLLAFVLFFPFMLTYENGTLEKVVTLVGFEVLGICLLLGFWAPHRIGHIAFRIACLLVFIAFVTYLLEEFRSGNPLSLPQSRTESSPGNALLGLFVIGLPALRYAIAGRFSSREESD